MILTRSLHYFIIFITCFYCMDRYCIQSKTVTSKTLHVKSWLLVKYTSKIPQLLYSKFLPVNFLLSLFSFWALEKLDLMILDFWLFPKLPILEWFSNWFFKYALITVRTYFKTTIAIWSSSRPPVLVLNFQPAGRRFFLWPRAEPPHLGQIKY